MELENNIYKPNKTKRKLVEELNCDQIEENREKSKILSIQQKDIIKNSLQKSKKNNYIKKKEENLSNVIKNQKNKNNKKINLIKELNITKFSQPIKKINLLINVLFLINSFMLIFANEYYEMRKYTFLNEITIKISGSEIQNILNENFSYKPDEIYIEGISYPIDEQNRLMNLANDEANITMKWNYSLTNCSFMFYGLSNIKEIDLTYFDLSQVISMNSMFGECYNLEYIKFNNNIENKLSVNDMSYMFENCLSLKYLDLSNFDTSLVTTMAYTFWNCISLTSLNLNGFNTSQVTDFMGTFINCNSLISLDLSSFDTSIARIMYMMFFNCSSLTSLNLSNFKTSNVYIMTGMFGECSKLISLNLSNFDTSAVMLMASLFSNCTQLAYLDISNFNMDKALVSSEMFLNCNNLQYINISNFIGNNNNNFFEGILENITYCFNSENEIPEFIEELKSKKCSINDCSDDWKIKTKKIIPEKDMCVYDCSIESDFLYEFNKTCYNDCPEGTYLSNENNKCIIICGEDLPFEMNDECVPKCNSIDFFNNICKINKQNINVKELMIDTILKEISDDSMDVLLSKVLNDEKKDYFVKNNNTEIFHITSLNNQKNSEYNNNISIIDIGECENILKELYEIDSAESLIIFKTDFYINNYSIPIIEYEIFHPQTKAKLNLNYCSQTKMKIYLPVTEIDEEKLYIYDPNSDYYKDKCYPYTSECGNDDTLEERKNKFNNNYLSLCENNCKYDGYNENTKMVLCACTFKSEFMKLSDIISKKDELLYYNFPLETDNLFTNSYSDESFNTNNNMNSDSNSEIVSLDELKECLFKSKITKECKDSIEFEDLINQNYMPVNSKDSIDKVFGLFQDQLKNKTINANQSKVIEGEDVIFHMTTTEQKATNNKISHIDFDECEKVLQEKYEIKEPLIIISVDIKRNDTISTQVEYQVFNPNTLEQLNLSFCENVKIDIYTPLNLDPETYNLAKQLKDQGYDLFNSSDDFYNDICSTFNSENDTDIILNDRRKDFYNSNITLCEDNCQYDGFDIDSLKVKCHCGIKPTVNSDTSKVKFSPNTILENFYNFEKYANIKIVTCYNLVFNLSRLKKNYGSYSIIIIGILFIISMIIIYATIYKKTNDILKNIFFDSLSLNKQKHNKNKNQISSKKKFKKNKKKRKSKKKKKSKNKTDNNKLLNSNSEQIKKSINNPNKKLKKNNNINNKISNIKIINKKNLNKPDENSKQLFYMKNTVNTTNEKIILKNSPRKSKNKLKNTNINGIYIFSNEINNYGNCLIIKNNKSIEKEKINYFDKIIDLVPKDRRYKYFIDDELNSLGYEYALNIDTRSYCQVYYSLLRQNHLIIFTFCVKNDYNIFLLKFALFLITVSLFLFMNALFFEDDSLHKLYEDQGKYNFLYQIPKILYSTIVTQIISSLLEKLSLSQDDILNIKENYNLKEINNEVKKVIKYITIKCILFFIVGIILLFGFWYYLSAFCAVYYNTQTPLINDNIASFLTSMLYPFLLDLIPVIFRIISLRNKMKCLYIFSKILIKIIGIL